MTGCFWGGLRFVLAVFLLGGGLAEYERSGGASLFFFTLGIGLAAWFVYDVWRLNNKQRQAQWEVPQSHNGRHGVMMQSQSDSSEQRVFEARLAFVSMGINDASGVRLIQAGYDTPDKLLYADLNHLGSLKGVGPKTIERIKKFQEQHGIKALALENQKPKNDEEKGEFDMDALRIKGEKLIEGRWTIMAKSSSGEGDYTIDLSINKRVFRLQCTCKAGQSNTFCKHRRSVIEGDEGILANPSQKTVLREMHAAISKTTLPEVMVGLDKTIAQIEKQKKELSKAVTELKKEFGTAMTQGFDIDP